MLEAAKKFIGTKCIIKTIDGSLENGILRNISEKALILELHDGRAKAINADYVINIDNLNTVTAFNCEPVFGNTRHFAFKYI